MVGTYVEQGSQGSDRAGALSASSSETPTAAVVELLSRAATHGEPAGSVERIETHISWIFLTSRYAYKLKKPVCFDFLDFRTVEQRHRACLDEVRLNRRLAPRVYLGVEPIVVNEHQKLRLGGSGRVVDWVVKMRRLPQKQSLDRLIDDNRVSAFAVRQLATRLTEFYLGLPPVTIKTEIYRERLRHHVEDNDRELSDPRHGLSAAQVKRIHAAQRTFLLLFARQFDERVCDGRIVEGHGDLRPEHIYLNGGATVIDGVEFNLEYRQLDVVDELCFLTMECAMLGHESLGQGILRQYCQASRDNPTAALCGFYSSYRACVRAKVSALRAEQLPQDARREMLATAGRYMQLAEDHARLMGHPLLLVVRGLSGSGKSTLAHAVADLFRLDLLQTDAIRRHLFPVAVPNPANTNPANTNPANTNPADNNSADNNSANRGTDRYGIDNRQRVYDEMLRRTDALLTSGCGVVLDGTFLRARDRQRALELACRCSATPLIVNCLCPRAVARQRIAARRDQGNSLSEAFPELVGQQQDEEESSLPNEPVCRVDSTSSVPEMLRQVTQRLRQEVGAP
jgi:aminoglycoside phosphotransferase family enzyme/predicted kinase